MLQWCWWQRYIRHISCPTSVTNIDVTRCIWPLFSVTFELSAIFISLNLLSWFIKLVGIAVTIWTCCMSSSVISINAWRLFWSSSILSFWMISFNMSQLNDSPARWVIAYLWIFWHLKKVWLENYCKISAGHFVFIRILTNFLE